MYTWILVFLLRSWKIETLVLKLKDQKLQTMQLLIVWIQVRPDILSVLIWVQTICKGYQKATLLGKE